MTNGHSSAQKHRTKWLSDTGRLPFWKTYTKRIPRTRPERSAALRESSGFKEPRGRVHDVENPWTTLCVLPAALSPITDQNSGQRNVFYVPSSFGRKRKKGNIYIYIYVYSPFYDEFAYEMKECPPRIEDRIHISTRKRVSHFFSPPDAYASSSIFACNEWPLVPVHTSEFLIPKMHQERYEP